MKKSSNNWKKFKTIRWKKTSINCISRLILETKQTVTVKVVASNNSQWICTKFSGGISYGTIYYASQRGNAIMNKKSFLIINI